MPEYLPSYQRIWKISFPIIISLVAQNIINVIDTAFLGRLGEVELGAAAVGGLFYFTLYMVGFGFGNGAQIMMGRRNGEQNFSEIGKIMDQGFYFLMLLALLIFFLISYFSTVLLSTMVSSEPVLHASREYLDMRMFGVFFAFINVMYRSFYVGITKTGILLHNALFMALVNVVLDYILIFGHWGAPAMGIAGAALASVISEGLATLYFIVFSIADKRLRPFHLYRFPRPDITVISRIMNISVFIMLQYFISMSAWFTFFLIIEKMGERPLAISNIIRSAYMVLMIPVFGFASTASTLVSNSIGEGNTYLVMPLISKVTRLTILVSLIVIAPTIIFPHLVISVFTTDPALIAATIPTVYVIAGALLLFSFTFIYFHGISGTGNTNVAMYIEFITLFIYLVFAFLLAVQWKLPIEIVWMCEYIYSIFLGGMSIVYLRKGTWKQRVI